MVRGKELIQVLNHLVPSALAVEKDRIGLQVGDPHRPVQGVLVTLDVTEAVVEEAIQKGANWIVAHHAVIFHPLKQIRQDQPEGRLLAKLIKHDIQVFIAHTNLDACEHGVNDVLADKLSLKNADTLVTYGEEKWYKLVVFVPLSHAKQVQMAMGDAGAGWIGNYSHCTFHTKGIGTFLPQSGSNPFIGEQGKLEEVEEIRLETLVTNKVREPVIQAMLKAHPYEEVAYDIYPLEQGNGIGFGKIGDLPNPLSLKELAEQVKMAYQVSHVRMVGDPNKVIKKVALLGGAGSRYLDVAHKQGADVYITGDIDFHTAHRALALDIGLIDPGHHVEHFVVPVWAKRIREQMKEQVPIYESEICTNPFQFV